MINVAILGFGVVGSGVAEVIEMSSDILSARLGDKVEVKYILDIRDFSGHPMESKIVRDINVILSDDSVSVVIEAMGGSHPAFDFSLAALNAKKSVVTSNKEVVANFGCQLMKAAQDNGVRYLFEASVGGAIPIIRPLCDCITADRIERIAGIMNGTTNYILTRMFSDNVSFENALKEAQEKGYAEHDPTADIDGIDACRKICILSDLAYGKNVKPDEVTCEGIRNITGRDVADATKWGGSIKLLGLTEKSDDGIYVIVCPFFVKQDNILSEVSDVFNGISVRGTATGDLMFYGRGAGKLPTASAMVADVVEAVSRKPDSKPVKTWTDDAAEGFVKPIGERITQMYLRLEGASLRDVESTFEDCEILTCESNTISFVTEAAPENELVKLAESIPGSRIASKIRILR